MGKSYIELKFRKRIVKLYTQDVAKVYKINKRKTPSLPHFPENDKCLFDTDVDNDAREIVNQ